MRISRSFTCFLLNPWKKRLLFKENIQPCFNFFLASIKTSFCGALCAWPSEQSMAINDVCVLQPYLGIELEITCLVEEQGAGGPSLHNYLHPCQSPGEIKCINRADGLSSEWALNCIDVVLIGVPFVLYTALQLEEDRKNCWLLSSQRLNFDSLPCLK